MLEPALLHAIRTAPKLKDCGYAMPPRRRGRDAGDNLIRNALIREAVSLMLEHGYKRHRAIIELAAALPYVEKKAIEAVVYADADLIRKTSEE